jgi:hypothetical protein
LGGFLVGPNNLTNFIIILVSTAPVLLYMHCFLPVKLIDVNIIRVTEFATYYLIWLERYFYAELMTYYFTHYYFPYKFMAKFESAPNDK